MDVISVPSPAIPVTAKTQILTKLLYGRLHSGADGIARGSHAGVAEGIEELVIAREVDQLHRYENYAVLRNSLLFCSC